MPYLANITPFLAFLCIFTIGPKSLVSTSSPLSSGQEFLSKLSDTFNLDPYLHSGLDHSGYNTQNHEEETWVSPQEASKYLTLLKYIDPRRSPLVRKFRQIVSQEPEAKQAAAAEMTLQEKLAGLITGDPKVIEELMERMKYVLKAKPEYLTDGDLRARDIILGIVTKAGNKEQERTHYSSPKVESQATVWDEDRCFDEYNRFIKPITNIISNGTAIAICTALEDLLGIFFNYDACIAEFTTPASPMPLWGIRMLDAMTKIPHSIGDGQKTWVGAYDYCQFTEGHYNTTVNETDIYSEPVEMTMTGKYCRLDLRRDAWANMSDNAILQLGVCVPSSCNAKLVVKYITQNNTVLAIIVALLQSDINFAFCGVEDVDKWTDPAYLANFCIIVIVLATILISTIYDGFFRKYNMNKKIISLSNDLDQAELEKDEKGASEESKKKCLKKISFGMRLETFFVGFSAYSNMRRIFTTHRKPGDIAVLNGIRFLTMCYVIWGQTFVYGPIYFESWVTANILYALRHIPTQFVYQAVINFHLTEDTFLLISGILLSYWYLKKHENIKKTFSNLARNAIYSLIHRYWRLMPAMMMCLMIFTCTYKFFSDGPLFPHEDTDGENCKSTWWVPMTMTHNLVMTSKQCFGHAWFVPIIFQLHLAALVVLVPLVIKPKLGYFLLGLMYLAHIGVTAYLSYTLRDAGDFGNFYDEYFVTPWCRAGPFLIGLALGIVIYNKSGTKVNINGCVNFLLWLVALFTIAAVSFWSLDQFKDLPDAIHPWGLSAHVAWDTLARSAWALGVGWIVYSCHFGHGGVVELLLTWTAWAPVSRLVYTSMLMHGMMIFNMVYTTRHAIVVEGYHSSYASLAHTIVCTLTGLVMSLVWDYPLSAGVHRTVTCPDRIAWIRAGRHSRKRLQELKNEFFPEDSNGKKQDNNRPIFIVSGSGNVQPIPNCNYVRASAVDMAQLGFEGLTPRPDEDDKKDGSVSSKSSVRSAESKKSDKNRVRDVDSVSTKDPSIDYEHVK